MTPAAATRNVVATACGIVVLLGTVAANASDARSRPNIVIIYADDLGYGDLSCYGHHKYRTPRIDQMAREGVRLTEFYSVCPFCAPSRASLLTGRYPFRHKMLRNPCPDTGENDIGLPLSEITLADLLKKAGYTTACYGKWHLGHKPEFYPMQRGFDDYFGILYSNDMRPVELIEKDTLAEFPVVQETLTKRYTERSLVFIEQNRERPFFLYLPHAMPHKPIAASEAFYKKSGAGLYGDALAELDWSVGQVLDKLKSLDLDRRTIVYFTSDNGPFYGGSTGGLRGMKGQCYEGGLRVPMIARYPGVIPEGKVSGEPAINMDLFATSLGIAGVKLPADRKIDGRDILPLLTSAAPSPHEYLFGIQERICTVRAGEWKLHVRSTPREANRPLDWKDPRAPDGKTIVAPFEQYSPAHHPGITTGDVSDKPALFNLRSDPSEQHNVAAKHPDVVERLLKIARDAEE